jgi:hypothetical protein
MTAYKTCDDCSMPLAAGPRNIEIKYTFGKELYVHIVLLEYKILYNEKKY